jgi:hypothetical protein
MTEFLISTGLDTLRTMIIAGLAVAPFMVYRRTRYVIIAMVRLTVRKAPRWARPMIVAAQFVPTQADDFIVFAIVLIPILRHERNRRVFARAARYAWNYDELSRDTCRPEQEHA